MHQFSVKISTNGRGTGATNWWKTSQNDRKQISNFASGWVVGYFAPNWSKIWESFLPYMGIICFHNILRFGYEAPLRVGYNKVTRGVNTHTQRRSCVDNIDANSDDNKIYLKPFLHVLKDNIDANSDNNNFHLYMYTTVFLLFWERENMFSHYFSH